MKWTIVGVAIYTLRSLLQFIFTPTDTINLDFGLEAWIGAVLLAGVTEEIVFRGFLLENFKRVIGFWYSNIISSLLFVVIHFPTWYMRGLIKLPGISFTMSSVLAISIFQGFIFHKSESLWASAISHYN